MRSYLLYILLFLLLCLVPSAGLLFGGAEESAENRTAAEAPVLWDEQGVNLHFLSDAGAWFEDHFAFRNEWVTGYALLAGKLFGTSSQERVIVGREGWLYYKDSLGDFQGEGLMSERQLFDVAHSLAMIQQYAKERGIRFAFTVAPNKNSLYGGNMPYYYQGFRPAAEEGNLARLQGYLAEEQVSYIDLYTLFQKEEEILYHATDSHWNNKGAALAADRLLSALGKEHSSYIGRAYKERTDFIGDLEVMLYPAAVGRSFLLPKEKEYDYIPEPQFTYQEEVESNFAPKITTYSAGKGSLVMYRDSFGNALLPFLAEAYGRAYFSRALPYQLSDLAEQEADTLLIERAERFLPDMAGRAPYMEAPEVSLADCGRVVPAKPQELTYAESGSYMQVTGKVQANQLQTRTRIYVKVNGDTCYEAFPLAYADGQEGFSLLIPTKVLGEKPELELYFSQP